MNDGGDGGDGDGERTGGLDRWLGWAVASNERDNECKQIFCLSVLSVKKKHRNDEEDLFLCSQSFLDAPAADSLAFSLAPACITSVQPSSVFWWWWWWSSNDSSTLSMPSRPVGSSEIRNCMQHNFRFN